MKPRMASEVGMAEGLPKNSPATSAGAVAGALPPRVSIVVVAFVRERVLDACLESLRNQSVSEIEIIVVLNAASPEVVAVARRHRAEDSRVVCLPIAAVTPGEARNRGFAKTRGELVYFLDDDVVVPRGGIATLVTLADRYEEFSVFGGPNLTPPDDPEFGKVTGGVLTSSWGSGITCRRYQPTVSGEATERDVILCNLAMRRRVLEDLTCFPSAIFGGEENVLLARARRRGCRIWYSPELWVYHRRRIGWRSYVEQIVRYGRGRLVTLAAEKKSFHPAFFLPLGLVAYLVALPWLVPLHWAAWIPGAVYVIGTLVASIDGAWRARRLSWFLAFVVLFPLTHILYAVGMVEGVGQVARACLRRLFSRRGAGGEG